MLIVGCQHILTHSTGKAEGRGGGDTNRDDHLSHSAIEKYHQKELQSSNNSTRILYPLESLCICSCIISLGSYKCPVK